MPTNDQIILNEVLNQRGDELTSPISESDYFELFACEQVLKKYDLSWEEIESGIKGAGGDGGIDGYFLFINGELIREDTTLSTLRGDISIELHIIQAKKTSGFSEAAIQKFRAATDDLLDLSKNLDILSDVYISQLLDAAAQFQNAYRRYASRFPRLSLSYYYATLGDEIHPNVKRQVTPLRETVSTLFSSSG